MPTSGMGTPYWYEWEIGLIECLNMMLDPSIQSVTLQSEDFTSLDDVVVRHSDGSLSNIQVKHTDTGKTISYSFLDNADKPLIQGWAKEWQEKKETYPIREIRIVTNKPWGPRPSEGRCSFSEFVTTVFPKLKEDYFYSSDASGTEVEERVKKAIVWYKKQLECIGEDAAKFTSILSFCQKENLTEVNQQIHSLITLIIGTEKTEAVEFCINNLFGAVETWATSKRIRQEITREDVYRIFCAGSHEPPRYELYPAKPIFPSRVEYAESFVEKIQNCPEKVIFLEGLPGAGKTNFISYLAQLENTIVDFRYYTYLPVNERYPSFSDDEGFYTGKLLWLSLLNQMRGKLEELGKLAETGFPMAYGFLSVSEMRMYALNFLPIYAGYMGRTCFFFIDGMDHAARSVDARNSFLSQLPQPEEIGENVKFVLVGQPINDKYPNWLVAKKDVLTIKLPVLNYLDVNMLLNQNGIQVPGVDGKVLAETIIRVVGENALNVLFAIREVHKMEPPILFDKIVEYLETRQLNNHISKYYEWMLGSVSHQLLLKKIQCIFASVSRKVQLRDLSLLCDAKEEDIAFLLTQLYPMIVKDEWGYFAYHNDVRLYLKDLVTGDNMLPVLVDGFRNQIEQQEELRQYTYDLLFELLFMEGSLGKIMTLFTPEYIVKSVRYQISATKLIRQFIAVAGKVQDANAGVYLKKLSPVATLISQLTQCVQYFEREATYFESNMPNVLTESEKYMLDSKCNFGDIITDIYSLLERKQIIRAQTLFNEYLSGYELSDYIRPEQHGTVSLYEQSGYICRYFMPRMLIEQSSKKSELYLRFVSGWLSAGAQMLSAEDIEDTLSFQICRREDILMFVKKVVESGKANSQICTSLYDFLLATAAPVSAVIELMTLMKLNDMDISAGTEYIKEHLSELVNDTAVNHDRDRIPLCIKAVFCLYAEAARHSAEVTY